MSILISIILPTYNPDTYIYTCLDSIGKQSFPVENFELILILNGAKAPYESCLKQYIENQLSGCNVQFIQTDTLGVSHARNVGIAHAHGDYLLFVDDDDFIAVNYLSALYGSRIDDGITVSNVKTFTDNPADLYDDYLSAAYRANVGTKGTAIFKRRSFLSTAACKLIPRRIIMERRYDVRFTVGEDSVFMFLLSDKIADIKLCPDADAIYFRRIRSHSASRSAKPVGVRLGNAFALLGAYTCIYIRFFPAYNLKLYLSRIAATLLFLIKR